MAGPVIQGFFPGCAPWIAPGFANVAQPDASLPASRRHHAPPPTKYGRSVPAAQPRQAAQVPGPPGSAFATHLPAKIAQLAGDKESFAVDPAHLGHPAARPLQRTTAPDLRPAPPRPASDRSLHLNAGVAGRAVGSVIGRPALSRPSAIESLVSIRHGPAAQSHLVSYGSATIQRKQTDKYDKQNTQAASYLRTIKRPRQTPHGNDRVSLAGLANTSDRGKLTGFSNKSPAELVNATVRVMPFVNEINGKMSAYVKSIHPLGINGLSESERLALGKWLYNRYILGAFRDNAPAQLREPHVNQSGGLAAVGDMDVAMRSCTDPVKWAWYYYAKTTESAGWEAMTGQKRIGTPQFAELGAGGFVPRIVYDYYRDRFYLTPHYNKVENKGLDNAYVKVKAGRTWSYDRVSRAMQW